MIFVSYSDGWYIVFDISYLNILLLRLLRVEHIKD